MTAIHRLLAFLALVLCATLLLPGRLSAQDADANKARHERKLAVVQQVYKEIIAAKQKNQPVAELDQEFTRHINEYLKLAGSDATPLLWLLRAHVALDLGQEEEAMKCGSFILKLKLDESDDALAQKIVLGLERKGWLKTETEVRQMQAARDESRKQALADAEVARLKPIAYMDNQGRGLRQNSLGMKFAPVPGTEVLFCIWETRELDYAAYAAANPGVDREFRDAAKGPAHPVVKVSWSDAKAFCAWLTEKERREEKIPDSASYRLPTDAEWSHAVGIGDREGTGTPKEKDQKVKGAYPWGDQWPPPQGAGNYAPTLRVDLFESSSPVGSFAPNKLGLYDLGGNVCEWCEDWYDGDQKVRVLRGASWDEGNEYDLLSRNRGFYLPDGRFSHYGFRVALAGSSPR